MRARSRRKKFAFGFGFDRLESRQLLSATPNDTYYSQQWGLDNANDVDINAPQAWKLNTGSSSVVVAVIGPTGVDLTSGDLANRLWTNPTPNSDPRYPGAVNGWDFTANSPNITDTNGHDTNVAGIIGAQANNGQGIAGINWNSPLMVLRAGTLKDDAAAIDFAVAHGAKVINMSVAWSESPLSFPYDPVYQAIQRAQAQGVVVVVAASNSGLTGSTSGTGQDLGGLLSQYYTVAPAGYRLSNMISVASVNSSGELSSFSNYGGTTVDVAAPGEMIETTGLGNGYIGWASGTSFAAPFVTGVVSLVMSQHPEFTAEQVIDRVLSTVKPLSGLAGKVITGGMVDAYAALLAGLPTAPTNLQAQTNGSAEVDLSWAPSTSSFTTGYAIERSVDGTNWSRLATVASSVTSYQDLGVNSGIKYSYRVFATSLNAGNSQAVAGSTVTVTTASAPTGSLSIDAGGQATGAYAADRGFSGGSIYYTSSPIDTSRVTDPSPQSVYQTERFGNFTYAITGLTPGNNYSVRLDFAEIYFSTAGQRVFNVVINGAAVLKNFDIVAATGGINRAIAYTYSATADGSGTISIAFTSVVNNAKVSGIRVTPTGPGLVAIDSGGGSIGSYSADTAYAGGSLYSTASVIDTSKVASPAPASVYQTERFGDFTYTIPGLSPGGAYSVRLDFAEIYFTSAGQRVFDVAINGAAVLKNFDIVAATGGINRAIAYTYSATADSSGKISITFTSIVNNAKVSGIMVTPGSSTTTPTPLDLAQGKATSSSSQEGAGFAPGMAVDGNSISRWSSGQWMQTTSIGWISIDLGSVTSISQVVLNWEAAFAADFQIQVSNDGKTWSTVKSVTGNSSGGWQTYSNLKTSGRYVRIYCTRMNATNNYSLYDLQVY